MKRPTQVDVAKLAGVSRATVSYVVNNQTGGRVPISAETRQRVLTAIDELGYVPDARAQALRSGSTMTIGLIIPNINNPHFWQIADGVEQAASSTGYHILLSSISPENKRAEDIFNNLTQRRIDGLVMVPSFVYQSEKAQATLAHLIKRKLPIVGIMSGLDKTAYDIDRVISNYRESTLEIMSHLLSLGHRRIGVIFGIAVPELGNDRLAAYEESLQQAGLPVDPTLIAHCEPTMEASHQATLQLLQRPDRPTAIIAINDLLAIGALRAMRDLKLRVPHDVSLVGYDDIPAANYLEPRLTTATKNGVMLGQEAMRLLLARMKDRGRPRQEVQVPARLIMRESTSAPASEEKNS